MSNLLPKCYIFVGPTAYGIDLTSLQIDDVEIYPPAQRGDIYKLCKSNDPGAIAIIDGTFHANPSVGHTEILTALNSGWLIWGLSSMGAIRAFEMQSFGMKGYGRVFEEFSKHDDFRDDEVTLIHGSEKPFIPITEPLVHIRECLNDLMHKQIISKQIAEDLLDEFSTIWYGYRSLKRLNTRLKERTNIPHMEIDQITNAFSRYRIKTKDMMSFLNEKSWLEV